MDDLLGEDWQKPTARPAPPTGNTSSNYSSFRASPQLPLSGTASPATLSRPSSTVNGTSKALGPANGDTFGGLLSLKSQKAPSGNVSLQERQKQLLEERRRQQQQSSQLWSSLGSGRSTPALRQQSPAPPLDEDDDILAAFNKDAPVNRASNFSPPIQSGPVSGRSTPAVTLNGPTVAPQDVEEDDPFDLKSLEPKGNGHITRPAQDEGGNNDDDILGDLGRPVSAGPPPVTQAPVVSPFPEGLHDAAEAEEPSDEEVVKDNSLAELVDMGFPADTAKIALNENGGNVQSAVGWLLQQAHEESRQRARGELSTSRSRSPQLNSRSPQRRQGNEQETVPAWMRGQETNRPSSATRQRDATAVADKDPTQVAQELGNKMWKSANTLWKASQKQMAKTIAELQQDHYEADPNQPKWMRDASVDSEPTRRRQPEPGVARTAAMAKVTDEAAALDAPRERPQKPSRPSQPSQDLPVRDRSPVEPPAQRATPPPRFRQQAPSQPDRRPTAKLSRQEVEDQTAQAYVSPARRKRPTPQASAPPPPAEEVDLFSSAPTPVTEMSAPAPIDIQPPAPRQRPRPPPEPPKPKAPLRNIPGISPTALQTSAKHRKLGGEHFKRGDYASAHESYTSALTPLPSTHPVAIVVLCNRSLTALKTGDAKVAVSDSDRALEIIGPSLGSGETIDLGAGEGTKEMKEFYGKALMRKAEALEHMEKYSDAAAVWRLAVEAGVGGVVSLKGKDRCEKAAAPKPAASTAPAASKRTATSKAPPAKSLGNSMQRPTLPSAISTEAVKKLRAANAEASKEEDEKFALSDSVDAKLTAWKGGKSDNLRALLQSMDVVLWPEAGWKKVGMADLVMPPRVKIIYMKAIGKVHPDKIPQDATTEQKMISAAVFSTLNEAWDKFKTENGL